MKLIAVLLAILALLAGGADRAAAGPLYMANGSNGNPSHGTNTATGAATLVGSQPINTFGSGLAARADGTIFLTGEGSDGTLRTVNKLTGTTTLVANLTGAPAGSNTINALDFDDTT